VSEAVSLSSAMKTPLAEWFADKGAMPSVPASIGSTTAGKYVASMDLTGESGGTVTIVATMKATDVNRDIAGAVFAMETIDGGKQWDCGEVGNAANDNTVLEKFLPAACRP